ncbi:calcium-dependent protein kinase 2-like [Condylostylus longicornis]|uniref:calcium-dependent protein kinase 2-like n=1 Tax=Condylostylus longicornis TaxID=2530218 RepID=UPI00244DF28E|nr:calcium-dependent protein kinase 2-like [Condylostylus longicornis]
MTEYPFNGSPQSRSDCDEFALLWYEILFFGNFRKAASSEVIHLMKWMLQKDPRKRCSARQALDHPWFRLMSKPRTGFSSQLTPSVFEGLRSWQNQNKLKQAVLQLMARELSESEIKDLRRKFEALDGRGDGTISLEELRYSVKQARYAILEADLEQIFASLAHSGSNRIHYTEFISALLDKRMKFEEAQLRNVFNKFDPTGEGRISIGSLRTALKGTRYGQLTDSDLEKIFSEIDKNRDG